jgi:hypothetical protein
VTTTKQTRNRIPNPLYAAAGAADLAYRKLRDLQTKVAEQRTLTAGREIDVERLRGVAKRNVKAFVVSAQAAQEKVAAGAQVAQEKAAAIYTDLVARGEQVVRGGARNADERRLADPAEVLAHESTAGEIAATAEADTKPVKPTRPTTSAK